MGTHPKSNNVIVATIDQCEYRAYVTHIELSYSDSLGRTLPAWQLRFSSFVSKKREKNLIAGWERNPIDPFQIEILSANPNKYQQHASYKGLAKFNMVVENTDLLPIRVDFVLDIIGAKVV